MEFNATFLVSVISFLCFTVIMQKILYEPVTKIVEEREQLIGDNYGTAKTASDKAAFIYKDRDEKISGATADAKKIAAEKIAKANDEAKIKTTEAKQNSIAKINSAKADIQAKSEEINREIDNRINDIAENISAKVLGEV